MTMDITYYDSPIDVMYLIHNALRAEAAGVTQRARQLGTANTLVAFAQALHQWASTLEEHARIEDMYMTPLLPARPVVQDNEVEHQRLTTLFRELASFLQEIPPQTSITPRLQRQVLGHVITLGVEHDNHLESEEDLVLPLVRQRFSEDQQCALVWRLVCAGGSQEAGTIGPWITAALTTAEQQALTTLLARWEALPRLASAPYSVVLEESPSTAPTDANLLKPVASLERGAMTRLWRGDRSCRG
jgi:hemerythrin-like domain-containing protein